MKNTINKKKKLWLHLLLVYVYIFFSTTPINKSCIKMETLQIYAFTIDKNQMAKIFSMSHIFLFTKIGLRKSVITLFIFNGSFT